MITSEKPKLLFDKDLANRMLEQPLDTKMPTYLDKKKMFVTIRDKSGNGTATVFYVNSTEKNGAFSYSRIFNDTRWTLHK